MDTGRSVAKNTFFQILGRGWTLLASLATTFLLTRTLGLKGYGDYVFITSFVLVFVGLTDFGITTIAVRESSARASEKETIFANVLGLRLVSSVLVFLVFNIVILFLPQFSNLRQVSFVASFVLIFLMLRTTAQSVFQTNLRMDIASSLEVISSLLLLVFIWVFLLLGKPISLFTLMIFWAVSSLFSSIAAVFLWKKFLPLKICYDRTLWSDFFKQAFPLGVFLFVNAVYDRGIDNFFLKTFIGSEAVGFYGLAYKIHANLIFGAAFLMNSLFPIISSYSDNIERLQAIYKKVFSLLLAGGILIFCFGFFSAPLIVKVLAGDNFLVSVNLLRILFLATIFSFLNHLTGYLMISLREQKKLLLFSLLSLSINLIFNLVFIPRFSYWAAAVVTVLTEAAIFFTVKNFLRKKYQFVFSIRDFCQCFKLLIRKKSRYFGENIKE